YEETFGLSDGLRMLIVAHVTCRPAVNRNGGEPVGHLDRGRAPPYEACRAKAQCGQAQEDRTGDPTMLGPCGRGSADTPCRSGARRRRSRRIARRRAVARVVTRLWATPWCRAR